MIESILNLISTVFYQVLYMSIIGSIFGLTYYFIRSVFDKEISAKLKCFIWIFILLTLIIPIRFEIKTEKDNISPVVSQIKDIKETSDNVLMSKIESIKELPKENELKLQNSNMAFTNVEKIDNSFDKDIIIKKDLKTIVLNVILPELWILGLLAFLITFVSVNNKIKSRTHKDFCLDNRINKILNEVKTELNIKKDIKVIIQNYKKIPSIYGITKTAILITEDILKEDDSTIKYIFLHELSHYKRKDLLFNYALVLIVSIHWFNPIIWFLFNKIRQDIELGADELATKGLDKAGRKEYGLTLINLIKNYTEETYTANILCITDDEKNLERRILMIKGKTKTAIIAIIITVIVLGIIAGIILVKFDNQKAFSHMEKLSGPGSSGLKEENEQVVISSEEKEKLEEYINEICHPNCPYKIDEFNDINEASKEWIYAHVFSTNSYVTEEYIVNYLQKLFGNNLTIDVKNDIASSDDIVMPTYDESMKKYVLPTYGMNDITGYIINNIELNNNEYVVNVIEYNAMADLHESDNNHELIISSFDANNEKEWKFRINQDTSEEEIKNEVLKRKDEFQSYNITVIKEDDKFIVMKIGKSNLPKQASLNGAFPLNTEYQISREFGKTPDGGMHTGVDFKANLGSEIMAVRGGTVIFSGYKGSYGNLIVIDHGNDLQTWYAHCSDLYKKAGDIVKSGDVIASVGQTGNTTGSQLHFEYREKGLAVEPYKILFTDTNI